MHSKFLSNKVYFLQIFGTQTENRKASLLNVSRIALTFEQKVPTTESFYPSISIYKLFAELGGTLGLWLGVGAVQFCFLGISLVSNFKRKTEKQEK